MQYNEDRIAIYSRKSRFTGKGESIGNQIELCRDYIRNLFGAQAADRCVVFEDEGFSGGNLNRPDFQRMMEEVRGHRLRAIVVYRLDRISRNISDFTALIDELTKRNVSFVSIREQFDTATPMGRAMMFIISVFSQLERETIAERIRDNMHELAKTGRWLGGNTPTGFTSESVAAVTLDGKTRKACRLKLIPEEAELVRTIFELYLRTDSLTAVEAELLHRRIHTRQGNDFTRFAIRGILSNPVYMTADEEARHFFAARKAELFAEPEEFDGYHGMMVYNRTDQEKGRTAVQLPMEEWIVAVGAHPGLIPAEQWIAVHQSLNRNKSAAYRKSRTNEALLTGRLYCRCGERMYPKLTKRRTPEGKTVFSYVCKMKERSRGERCGCRNADGNGLDSAVMEQLRVLGENRAHFAAQLERSRRLFSGEDRLGKGQLDTLRAEREKNEKTLGGLIDSLGMVGDCAARPRILKRIEELTGINRELESRLRELERRDSADGVSGEDAQRLLRTLPAFGACVDGMSLEEKRAAVRALISRVVWDGETARILLPGGDGEKEFPGDEKARPCEDSK